jgi:hypothetical protein
MEHLDVKFLKVDIDLPSVAASVRASNISAVPTFTFHRGGKNLGCDVRGADVDALKSAVARLKGNSPP